jgi:MFS family permease
MRLDWMTPDSAADVARVEADMASQATTGSTARPVDDSVEDPDTRLPGLLFVILGVAFITGTMLLASIAPAYDFNGAAISDLGGIAQTAFWFNGLLVALAVMNVTGGYLYYRWHRRAWLFALYAIAAIGALGAGLFPLSSGGLHSLFALVAFLFFNLEGLGTAALLKGPMNAWPRDQTSPG